MPAHCNLTQKRAPRSFDFATRLICSFARQKNMQAALCCGDTKGLADLTLYKLSSKHYLEKLALIDGLEQVKK